MEDTRSGQKNMMDRLDFFIGDWNLEYKIPKSRFSEAATGTGSGTFRRALNDKYVYFDYSSSLTTGDEEGHGIIAWDQKIYRYWWFEDSGCFSEAAGDFIDNETLFLKWHDTPMMQTFKRIANNELILRMEGKAPREKYELILEVVFTRKR